MRSCAVCKKKDNKENGPFFYAPKCETRRQKWNSICQVNLTPHSRLCVDHFSRQHVITAGGRFLLMPNAEPVMQEQQNVVLAGLPDAYDPLINSGTRTPVDKSFQEYPEAAELPMNLPWAMRFKTMLDDLCRICAKTIKGEDALGLFENENNILLLKIKDLTGVYLSNETGLPKLICLDCNSDILQVYKKFREDFLKVQASFNIHIRGSKQQKCNRIIKEREFVVEEETNILVSDNEPIFEDEKEINIPSNKILSFENINDFELNSCGDNALEDTKNTVKDNNGTKLEYNIDEIEAFCDLEVKEIRESDEEFGEPIKKLKDAKENPKVFVCDQCGNQFNFHTTFKIHLQRHSGVKQCACKFCPYKFITNGELRRHMRKHTGERPYACRFCDRRFTDCSTRIKHERTHTNERPYACHLCDKSFTSSYVLKNHMLSHTGEKEFKCDVCNREFSRKTNLDAHFTSKMHKEAVEDGVLPSSNVKSNRIKCKIERRYECSVCDKWFKAPYILRNHMLTHTGVKDFICAACNKAFARKSQLDAHFATQIHKQSVENTEHLEFQE